MKNLTFIALIITFALSSCKDNDSFENQELEQKQLELMYSEIIEMAASVKCEQSDKWTYSPIGSKACGGPTGYIAYSTEINTEEFLQKLAEYRIAMDNYNKKWGIISDCSIVRNPDGVDCINNEPVFLYLTK